MQDKKAIPISSGMPLTCFFLRHLQTTPVQIPIALGITKESVARTKANILDASRTAKSALMRTASCQLEAARRFRNGHLATLNADITFNGDAEQRALLFRRWRHSYERLVRLEKALNMNEEGRGMRIKRFHEMSTREWISVNGPKHVHAIPSLCTFSGDCWLKSTASLISMVDCCRTRRR